MQKRNILFFGLGLFLTIFFCGGGEKKSLSSIGAPIPNNLPVTSLSQILSEPNSYQEKEVLLEGTVGSFCSSGCEFTYQEGVNSIKVFADFGPKILKLLKKGRPIRLYGKVKGKEKPFLILLGLEIKEKEK
jgi:hypothetical protein|uniref:Uncharacterized protein n=1 Tax=candidate division WOR-3 bacterium TaxID=2052148 RepID=A0A7C3Z062_UNCW3